MPDIEVVRLALGSAYTLIRDSLTDGRGIVRGLRVAPLASRLTMSLLDDVATPRELAFRLADLSWVAARPQQWPSLESDPTPIWPAEPAAWLDANWPAITTALMHRHALTPARRGVVGAATPTARWAVVPLSEPARTRSEPPGSHVCPRTHQAGDLSWAGELVARVEISDETDSPNAPLPVSRRSRPALGTPWWDLGAWHFGERRPRI